MHIVIAKPKIHRNSKVKCQHIRLNINSHYKRSYFFTCRRCPSPCLLKTDKRDPHPFCNENEHTVVVFYLGWNRSERLLAYGRVYWLWQPKAALRFNSQFYVLYFFAEYENFASQSNQNHKFTIICRYCILICRYLLFLQLQKVFAQSRSQQLVVAATIYLVGRYHLQVQIISLHFIIH